MDKILVAIPTDDRMYVETAYSLKHLLKPDNSIMADSILQSSLLHASRNQLAAQAIEEECTHLLFIDSDMVFNKDALIELRKRDEDIVTGLYVQRRNANEPTIYRNVRPRTLFNKQATMESIKNVKKITDDIFEVEACGLGFCLIRVEVLRTVLRKCGELFEPFKGLGEDISFCVRARKCGYKIMCDKSIPLGHVGTKVYTINDFDEKN